MAGLIRVTWRTAALADLDEIGEYIKKDNPTAARRVVSEIRARALVLAGQPYIGRAGVVEGTREFVVPKYPYIIVYDTYEHSVDILAVVHTSKRWPVSFD